MNTATRLFVGNLPDKVNEDELREAFSTFGEISALDIKSKAAVENHKKLFAFVTLSASNYDIESCIKHFTYENFNGTKLYVTRARESFLERLQRERELAQRKENEKNELHNADITPEPLNINLNSYKRKLDSKNVVNENGFEKKPRKKTEKEHKEVISETQVGYAFQNKAYPKDVTRSEVDDKKHNSDKKRLDSMKKKREEFNQKKMIIKSGFIGIDKVLNKKVIFSDDVGDKQEFPTHESHNGVSVNHSENNNARSKKSKTLFDEDDDSDNEVNFEIKKQFEGKKGQKVLDMQSRYKADKRFVLDERFIEDDKSDEEQNVVENNDDNDGDVELGQVDEKYKQLNILQDVLGVPIKVKQTQDPTKQTKTKLGMLRFDPTQPEHAKFLAPVTTKQEQPKKSKKKKSKETPEEQSIQEEPKEIEKVEVSKEQFYKVSDTLKEAMAQPSSFSLRSLFGKEDVAEIDEETPQIIENEVPQSTKPKKVKNPLDPGEKNPFVYDSSDSENEEETKVDKDVPPQIGETKPVWRENLFFSESDDRLKEGLLFFMQNNQGRVSKDRRELKSVMKKRVYNKERKSQMFQKKIGGRRKTVKKNFRKKS